MANGNSPYRLGLDVGSNSLGWFMVWLDGEGEPVGARAGRRAHLSRMGAIRNRRPRTRSTGGSRAARGGGATAI